ncbi:MAG: hypothetical protein ABEJ76_09555 [Halanaeroarchaeum sp.]
MSTNVPPDEDRLGLPRPWRAPLAYALVIVGTYLLALVLGSIRAGEPSVARDVLVPVVFPVLYFFLPPVLGAWQTAATGRVRHGLAMGLVPALAFPVLVGIGRLVGVGGYGDAPLGALVLLYAVIGLLGAGVGASAVVAVRRLTGE